MAAQKKNYLMRNFYWQSFRVSFRVKGHGKHKQFIRHLFSKQQLYGHNKVIKYSDKPLTFNVSFIQNNEHSSVGSFLLNLGHQIFTLSQLITCVHSCLRVKRSSRSCTPASCVSGSLFCVNYQPVNTSLILKTLPGFSIEQMRMRSSRCLIGISSIRSDLTHTGTRAERNSYVETVPDRVYIVILSL